MKKLCKLFTILIALTSYKAQSAEDSAYYTEEGVKKAVAYCNDKYGDLLQRLRESHSVSKPEVEAVFDSDPDLKRRKQADGHSTYEHKRFSVTFGCVGRKNNEVGKDERTNLIRRLQSYINALRLDVFKINNKDMSLKKIVEWANSVTPAQFDTFFEEALKKYDDYSQYKPKYLQRKTKEKK